MTSTATAAAADAPAFASASGAAPGSSLSPTSLNELRANRAELAGLVDRLDASSWSGFEAARAVEVAGELERLAGAVRLLSVPRVVETKAWADNGATSPSRWLAGLSGSTVGDAAKTLETATQLDELPATQRRVRQGRLSAVQAREIADAATANPSTEAALLSIAAKSSVAELRAKCRDSKAAAAPTDADEAYDKIRRARRLRWWTDGEGGFNLSGRSTVDDGALIKAILEPIADRLFREARQEGRRETTDAYRHDALIEVFRLAGLFDTVPELWDLLEDDDEHDEHEESDRDEHRDDLGDDDAAAEAVDRPPAGDPEPEPVDPDDLDDPDDSDVGDDGLDDVVSAFGEIDSLFDPTELTTPVTPSRASQPLRAPKGRPPPGRTEAAERAGRRKKRRRSRSATVGSRAKVIVRLDYAALTRGWVQGEEVCDIAGIGPIPVRVARELLDDAFLAVIITKGTDVHTVAHLGRQANVHQNTALNWTDAVCTTEGCPNSARLETDHTEEWARTRHTTLTQLGRPCSTCHTKRTRHGYRYGPVNPVTGKRPLNPPNPHPAHPPGP